jgi:hypothetical protein
MLQEYGGILETCCGRERIDALGAGVSRWKIGQRVGVGFFGGAASPKDFVENDCGRLANKRRSPGGHLIQHSPEGKQIRTSVNIKAATWSHLSC